MVCTFFFLFVLFFSFFCPGSEVRRPLQLVRQRQRHGFPAGSPRVTDLAGQLHRRFPRVPDDPDQPPGGGAGARRRHAAVYGRPDPPDAGGGVPSVETMPA